MLVKIYWSGWALSAAAAILLFATGTLTMLAVVALGFIAFGLTFMGMMSVLPATIAHPVPEKPVRVQPAVQTSSNKASAKGFGVLKSA